MRIYLLNTQIEVVIPSDKQRRIQIKNCESKSLVRALLLTSDAITATRNTHTSQLVATFGHLSHQTTITISGFGLFQLHKVNNNLQNHFEHKPISKSHHFWWWCYWQGQLKRQRRRCMQLPAFYHYLKLNTFFSLLFLLLDLNPHLGIFCVLLS